jgi:hypothetical protein
MCFDPGGELDLILTAIIAFDFGAQLPLYFNKPFLAMPHSIAVALALTRALCVVTRAAFVCSVTRVSYREHDSNS